MDERETFPLDGLDVSIEETADALTYLFVPRDRGSRPGALLTLLVIFVLYPLGLLALVAYAHSKVVNRPEWEDALTSVFAGQLLLWLVVGTIEYLRILRWWYRPSGIVLKFTRTHLWHGTERVCELEQVRGLRLFRYTTAVELLADSPLPRADAPPDPNAKPLPPEFAPIAPEERPAPKAEASLSLVIGEEGYTHGLFGGFEPQPLRALAEHIHRRLAAFRFNQGIMAPLDALSVVETTQEDAQKLMHTRPATGSSRWFSIVAPLQIFVNRWVGIPWCTAMLAGLFASGRMIGAAGFSGAFLLGHGLLGLIHFFLLAFHLGGHSPPKKQPDAE